MILTEDCSNEEVFCTESLKTNEHDRDQHILFRRLIKRIKMEVLCNQSAGF